MGVLPPGSVHTYLKRPGPIDVISIFRKIMKPGGIEIREILLFTRSKGYYQTDAQGLLLSFKFTERLRNSHMCFG